MTTKPTIDPAEFLQEQLVQARPDLLRADAGGSRDPGRTNQRNGYSHRDLDTRIGTLVVAVP